MPKIELLLLRCRDPQSQREFYCDVLGMKEYSDGSVGFGGAQSRIKFLNLDGDYDPQANDLYWKITLAVPNISVAYTQLTERSIQVSLPSQFEEVGYLAEFSDPEGFTIELIDHWFKSRLPRAKPNQAVLGGGAHLNLITLRTANIDKTISYCTNRGMKTLSIQIVESYGFTLYFFAFTSENSPSSDPYAVENREWLYQRQFTILEVQYIHQSNTIKQPLDEQPGYAGIVFSGLKDAHSNTELLISSTKNSEDHLIR